MRLIFIAFLAWLPFLSTIVWGDPFDSVKAHYDAYVAEGKIAGYSALVSKGGEIKLHTAAGHANLALGTQAETDTIYRIYSMTKPVTGVALMMLYEEGRFALDDPVSKYLPGFRNQRVYTGTGPDGTLRTEPVRREATILDLMRHTAGLSYGESDHPVDKLYRDTGALTGMIGFSEGKENAGHSLRLERLANKVGALPLLFHPGEAWEYSVAVDVQGALVEKLSGMSLEAFFASRIFTPLGMKDTSFVVGEADVHRTAEIYEYDADGALVPFRGRRHFDLAVAPPFATAGAGLMSTAHDYWKFCQMLLNGGSFEGVRLLKPETVDLLRGDLLPDGITEIAWGSKGIGFGMNFAVVHTPDERPSKSRAGEYYWAGLANSLFFIDPNEGLVGVLMVSLMPPNVHPFQEDMRNLVYGASEQ